MKIGDRVQRVPETFGETEEIRDRNRKRKGTQTRLRRNGDIHPSAGGGSMWWLLRHGGAPSGRASRAYDNTGGEADVSI